MKPMGISDPWDDNIEMIFAASKKNCQGLT